MSACDDSGTVGNLYIGDTNALELVGLYDPEDSAQPAITTAVVTVTGVDSLDAAISGVTWPLTAVYDSEADKYTVDLPDTADLVLNSAYTFIFTVSYETRVNTWRVTRYAIYRGDL